MKVYFGRPISGSTPQAVQDYYDSIINNPKLKQYQKFIPLVDTETIRCEGTVYKASGYTGVNSDKAIYERDAWFAKNCDIFHVNLLDATKGSLGCVAELNMAKQAGAHTIVVMKSVDQYHTHPFVLVPADIVFENLEESIDYLSKFWKGE